MYTTIEIHNFRGIKSLRAEGLRRINLIVGRNNSGKTTFLEAMNLLCAATYPIVLIGLGQLRGHEYSSHNLTQILTPLFNDVYTRNIIEIKGRRDDEENDRILRINPTSRSTFHPESIESDKWIERISKDQKNPQNSGLELTYTNSKGKVFSSFLKRDPSSGNLNHDPVWSDDFRPTTMISTFACASFQTLSNLFSELKSGKAIDVVLDAVQIVEPSIKELVVLSEENGSSLYADIGIDKLIPISACGAGTTRCLSIVLDMFVMQNGALLIDDIDNGLHYSVMKEFWEKLDELAKQLNVQIVATTHNEEMMRLALNVFADKPGTLGLFRIDRKEDRHVFTVYDDEAMKAVAEYNFETRG
jgi:energy-coupling factor transporter ATP-binding protein EcfA2